MTYFIIFVGFLCGTAFAQRTPTISFISKEKVVNIGDNIELKCTVQYAAQYSVLWVKINAHDTSTINFISSGAKLIIPDPRYSVVYDENTLTYILKISKVQEIDVGLYQCQIVTGALTKQTSEVWVYIRLPPVISDNSTRSVITATESTIQLHCHASGYPPPRISWRREGNDLLPNGGAMFIGNTLTIKNVTKEDRGTYYCVADNGVGKGDRRNIGVEVEFAPVVIADKLRYLQALQYRVDLLCHIEAFPSPFVMWYKDGEQLSDNQDYKISFITRADEFTDTTLEVIRIEKREYGNYTCQASNKLGSDKKVIELEESFTPVCPPACEAVRYMDNGQSQIMASVFCVAILATGLWTAQISA